MELSEKVENIGGNGYAAGGWGIGLFLMAIFLVVLFSLWRGHGEGGGYGGYGGCGCGVPVREGCADKLTWARFANYEDPYIARLEKDQAADTGRIMNQMSQENAALILNQEKTTSALLMNQNAIAREQERTFFTAQMDAKNEALAVGREKALMLEGKILQEQAAREADRRQVETLAAMNVQFYSLTNRLGDIEANMLRAPRPIPFVGMPCTAQCATIPCGPTPFAGAGRGGCGSCA